MGRYRVSMDIGGTFTDVVAHNDEAGTYAAGEACTNPHDVTEGVFAALAQVVEDVPELGFCVHGTTVGLNAFLQRRGGRVLLLATEGAPPEVVINPGRPDEQRKLKSAGIGLKSGDIVRGARGAGRGLRRCHKARPCSDRGRRRERQRHARGAETALRLSGRRGG